MIRYSLMGALLAATLCASTLEVYSDRSFYEYQPLHPFLGFAKNVSAQDDHSSLSLVGLASCESESELCRVQNEIRKEDVITSYSIHYTKLYDLQVHLHSKTTDHGSIVRTVLQRREEQFGVVRFDQLRNFVS